MLESCVSRMFRVSSISYPDGYCSNCQAPTEGYMDSALWHPDVSEKQTSVLLFLQYDVLRRTGD